MNAIHFFLYSTPATCEVVIFMVDGLWLMDAVVIETFEIK